MSTPKFANYIDGAWVESAQTFDDRNPTNTDEFVGIFSKGSSQDVEAAAEAAGAALPAWSSMAGPARGNILYKAADILERQFDQLGAEMTREEGKTLPEAKGEVRRAINILRYFGGVRPAILAELGPSEREPGDVLFTRKPQWVDRVVFPSTVPSPHIARE